MDVLKLFFTLTTRHFIFISALFLILSDCVSCNYGRFTPYNHHMPPWCHYRSLIKLPRYNVSPYRTWNNGNNQWNGNYLYTNYPYVQGGYPASRESVSQNVRARNLRTGQTSNCQPGEVYVYRPQTVDFDAVPSMCPRSSIFRFLPCHCERGCRHKNFFIPHDKSIIVDKCGKKCSCSVKRPGEVECEYGSC